MIVLKKLRNQEFAVKKNSIAVALLAVGIATLAAAQTAAPNKVGVIQVQSALVATRDGQKAAKELEDRMAPRKKELDGKQAEIRELQERLQKGGNTLSDSAKEDLTRNIDQKTKSFNRQVEDAQAELEHEQQKVLSSLGQKMMQVIDKYAQEKGFSVILDVSNQNTPVLYASNTVDITKDIVELYDKSNIAASAAPAAAPKPAVQAAPAAPAAVAPKPAAPKPAAAPATKQ
jgi:outer membrane protein